MDCMADKRYFVKIDKERCKGFELGVALCPKQVLVIAEGMNRRGQHYAKVARVAGCVGCQQCAEICPDAAIEIDVAEDEV